MRPTTRPPQPYTRAEILDRVYQHFAVEGNPKCVVDKRCSYVATGCAIGCMMTMEDANEVEGAGSIVDIQIARPDIFNLYFVSDDIGILMELQVAHDRHFADPDKGILAVLRKYGYPVKPDAELC